MFSLIAAHAKKRALAAGLIGVGLGLGLGGAYAVGHHQTAEIQASEAPVSAVVVAIPQAAAMHVAADAAAVPAMARMADQAATRRRDLDCLTEAVYFEARGETVRGQEAVAQVVLNRTRHPAFPGTVCGVVYQGAKGRGCQFSFACDGKAEVRHESGAWRRARKIAIAALAGVPMAAVGEATHFHNVGVSPNWGPHMMRVGQVGLHVFYRLGGGRQAKAEQERPQVVLTSYKPTVDAADAMPAVKLSMAMLQAPASEHADPAAAPAATPTSTAPEPKPAS